NAAWAAGEAAVNSGFIGPDSPIFMAARDREQAIQAMLLRDVVGPLPFRALYSILAPAEGNIYKLATTIYENGEFTTEQMVGLAAALQRAYPKDDEVLAHCRNQQLIHVRGCWVLDLILGKK